MAALVPVMPKAPELPEGAEPLSAVEQVRMCGCADVRMCGFCNFEGCGSKAVQTGIKFHCLGVSVDGNTHWTLSYDPHISLSPYFHSTATLYPTVQAAQDAKLAEQARLLKLEQAEKERLLLAFVAGVAVEVAAASADTGSKLDLSSQVGIGVDSY